MPGDERRDAGGDGREEGRHQHDRLIREAYGSHGSLAQVAHHECVGQPHRHVEHLLADRRQRQIENSAVIGVAEAGANGAGRVRAVDMLNVGSLGVRPRRASRSLYARSRRITRNRAMAVHQMAQTANCRQDVIVMLV